MTEPAPMSQPNRLAAYLAAEKLRALGYAWDDTAESWVQVSSPPVAAPATPYRHVEPTCEDAALLWAEIHHLRAATQGPEGFATWQEAATAERVRRVKAERAAQPQPQPAQPEVVGLFSVGADGDLCFHGGSTDPASLCDTLDENVTGGPYRARVAYAGPVIERPGHG